MDRECSYYLLVISKSTKIQRFKIGRDVCRILLCVLHTLCVGLCWLARSRRENRRRARRRRRAHGPTRAAEPFHPVQRSRDHRATEERRNRSVKAAGRPNSQTLRCRELDRWTWARWRWSLTMDRVRRTARLRQRTRSRM